MKTDPFQPITRAMALTILDVSPGTLDKHVKDGDLPPPRPFGNGRKLYWVPEQFYACLRRGLQPNSAVDADEEHRRPTSNPPATPQPLRPAKDHHEGTAVKRAARLTHARVKKMNS